jgi:hypothetical protein
VYSSQSAGDVADSESCSIGESTSIKLIINGNNNKAPIDVHGDYVVFKSTFE